LTDLAFANSVASDTGYFYTDGKYDSSMEIEVDGKVIVVLLAAVAVEIDVEVVTIVDDVEVVAIVDDCKLVVSHKLVVILAY
jgi:hypothetical protein